MPETIEPSRIAVERLELVGAEVRAAFGSMR
jgi:hypothetical protein